MIFGRGKIALSDGLYPFFPNAREFKCQCEFGMQTPDIEQKLLDLINDLDRFRQDKWFSQELNIFKAVGLYRQEIRHSNFLAFLLSPQQNHGLKDGFLKRLIQKASDKFAGEPSITPLKIALADFSDAIVSREWRNIDVLVESKSNQFIFAIENKIELD